MGLKATDRFFLSWSLFGAIGMLVIWNLPWRFQVNDDVIMMWLVSGAFTGEPEPYAVFIHPILSGFFSLLYGWFPGFNWYAATWFLTVALAYGLLVFRLSFLSINLLNRGFLAFFLLLTSFHLCIFPQFTLVAGFAAFSALILCFSDASDSNGFPKGMAFFLFGMSLLIRWESSVLMGLGFGLFIFLKEGKTVFGSRFKQYLPLLILFFGLLGTKILYERNSQYAEFLNFNRIRAGVIDHPIFRQEILENQIPLNSDFYFFSRWYFEGEHPTEEELRRKKKELDSQYFSLEQLLNSLDRFWKFQKVEAFKSFLIAWILILFFHGSRKSTFLFLYFGIWLLFFFTFNHFYSIQGRVIFLFFLCLLFPVLSGFSANFSKAIITLSFAACFLVFVYHGNNFLQEAKGRAIMDQEFLRLKSRLEPSVPLIFEGYQEHNLGLDFTVSNPVPFISTGWISRSEFQQKALKRFNLNGFKDISRFALITPTTNTEIVFPTYMNHAFGGFERIDSVRTSNFILLQFERK